MRKFIILFKKVILVLINKCGKFLKGGLLWKGVKFYFIGMCKWGGKYLILYM
jgi:hypothetical protein